MQAGSDWHMVNEVKPLISRHNQHCECVWWLLCCWYQWNVFSAPFYDSFQLFLSPFLTDFILRLRSAQGPVKKSWKKLLVKLKPWIHVWFCIWTLDEENPLSTGEDKWRCKNKTQSVKKQWGNTQSREIWTQQQYCRHFIFLIPVFSAVINNHRLAGLINVSILCTFSWLCITRHLGS